MEYYDIIIIGAGIAGCGLAYNLKRIGYQGSVLMIDKKGIGTNVGYKYKIMTDRIVNEYDFISSKKFKGLKIGPQDGEGNVTISRNDHFVNYSESCKSLFKKANVPIIINEAKSIKKDILITNNGKFKFKYIIDCSGVSFFTRKLNKKEVPNIYWIGFIRILDGELKNIDKDYYYYMFGETGSFEDLYYTDGKIIHGYWQYTKTPDFNLIKIPNETFFKNHVLNPKIIVKRTAIIPNSPVFPIVYKNIALLGDSFGIPYPASGLGIDPTLDSSKILAYALKKNNMKIYEKEWKKRYMKSYISFLASRLDRYLNPKIFQILKKRYPKNIDLINVFRERPETFNKLLDNNLDIDLNPMLKQFPKHRNLFLLYYYIKLKLKYFIMETF